MVKQTVCEDVEIDSEISMLNIVFHIAQNTYKQHEKNLLQSCKSLHKVNVNEMAGWMIVSMIVT